MSTLNETAAGCAMCNPALQKPLAEEMEARRKELTEVLHVVEIVGGYHLLQIPGDDGAPCTTRGGSFDSEAAADLYRDDIIAAMVEGIPNNACGSGDIFAFYDIAARILAVIEQAPQDPKALARAIADACPWRTPGVDDWKIPF